MVPVRFHLALPVLMGITAVLQGFTFSLTGSFLNLGLAVMFGLLAGLQATQPVFVYTGDAIEMRNLFGMTMRTHSVPDITQLKLEGNTVTYGGKSIVGAFTGLFCRGSDWAELLRRVDAGT